MIETATSACSVALIEGDSVIAEQSAVVGRGHAERLLPMIATLPDGGKADIIWVDCGPGSFTGIRVGIAAARALGFGWQVPVHGFSSLALLAATWFRDNVDDVVTVVTEGGHGEVFVQPFRREPFAEIATLVSVARGSLIVHGSVTGTDAPQARNAVLLGQAHLAARPIYGRAPDAKPMAA